MRRLSLQLGVWAGLVLVAPGTGCFRGAREKTTQATAGDEKAKVNPLAGNVAAVREGASLFRGNCSPCHGLNARGGGRGPSLTSGRWTHGGTDAEIFHTISEGVPGTEMPANSFNDSETWAIIAYLRSLAPPKQAEMGDAAKGEAIFWGEAGCRACHMVRGRGGRLGPDLSRVGAARSEEYLEESIREPSKQLSDGMVDINNHYGYPLVYDTVTVVTRNNEQIKGIVKNEDTFSIQMMDMEQNLRLFLKKDLLQVKHERASLMPPYTAAGLNAEKLRDLVAYLKSLD
jgi:cytochrome c oxidase cbb3-type subunit 3